jgi:hypothetical protein
MSDRSTPTKRFVGLQGYLLGAAAIVAAITTLIGSIGQLREAWCNNVGLLCVSASSDRNFADLKPVLRSPDDESIFDNFPRKVDLAWEPIPGAVTYQLETEIQVNGPVPNSIKWVSMYSTQVTENHATIVFNGANWGRWRIYAVSKVGEVTKKSNWRTFLFTH